MLMESLADKVIYDFVNSGSKEGVAGVHMSVHVADATGKHINAFLPLEQAGKLMLGLYETFKHAFDEASEAEKNEIRHMIWKFDSINNFIGKKSDSRHIFNLPAEEKT